MAREDCLAAVLWENERPGRVPASAAEEAPAHELLCEAERQLTAYFAGRQREFRLPVVFRGTEFQQKVWRALTTIPFGETRSYSWIAREVGSPAAVRAVGGAIGRNPLSILVPCHRVIGAMGQLTGFAGGLAAKRFLLEHETA